MVGYGREPAISPNMLLVLVCSVFCFCFSPAVSLLLDLEEGESCVALGGEPGTCQLLSDCHNPGDFKKEHPPICTFQKKIPVICCPISTGIKEEDFRFKFGSNKAARYCKNQTASCEKHRGNAESDLAVEAKTAKSYANNFMAIIGYGEPPNQVWKCSGTLITSKFILSAASCAEPKGLGPAMWAKLGGTQNNSEGWINQIVERLAYPDYNEKTLYNDLALFQLHKEVTFSRWIGPVCLHNGRLLKGEVTAIVWGSSRASPASPSLIKSKMIIEGNDKCQRLTPASSLFPKGVKEKLMFCASVEDYDPKNCLMETAGGPILVRVEGECLGTQIGIASYRKESCGETNYPTVYTKVSAYLGWIESIVFHVLNM